MRLTITIIIAFLLFSTCGCRTVETVKVSTSDTAYTRHDAEHIRIDSVFLLRIDSVFIRETADTVFHDITRLVFRDRYHHDTVVVSDTVRHVRDSIVYIERDRKQKDEVSLSTKVGRWTIGIVIALVLLAIAYFYFKIKSII